MNAVEFGVTPGERQLFLDDFGVQAIDDLARTMHAPAKKGAVLRADWTVEEDATPQIRSAPQYDAEAKLFKLWVRGRRESPDGLHWRRALPDANTDHGEVVYDGDDPDPNRRFKAFYPNRRHVSADGISWMQLPGDPVESQDEHNFSFDRRDRVFIATVKQSGPYGRSVFLSTSEDFANWTKPELTFSTDDKDQELGCANIEARRADSTLQQPGSYDPEVYNVDVYNMGVYRYESVYIGHPAMYHAAAPHPNPTYPNTDGFHLVELVCSRDLKSWQRLGNRQPFIGPSPLRTGAYDRQQIIGPSDVVVRDDELWIYYTGLKYRGTYDWIGNYPDGEMKQLPGYEPDRGAICLAVLRRDGFISLDAGADGGSVETKLFAVPFGGLHVNVDAHGGELVVEALDEKGAVLATSVPIAGDLPNVKVEWREADGSSLTGRDVSLFFNLHNAELFSYWFE